MVKMTSYDENIKKSKNFEKSIFSFFVPMALGKPPSRPSRPRAAREPPGRPKGENMRKKCCSQSCRESYADHDPALFRAGNLAPGYFPGRVRAGTHSPDRHSDGPR